MGRQAPLSGPLPVAVAAIVTLLAMQAAISTSDHHQHHQHHQHRQHHLAPAPAAANSSQPDAAAPQAQGQRPRAAGQPQQRAPGPGGRPRKPAGAAPRQQGAGQEGAQAGAPELAQEEARRMLEYRNTPPLFVTTTRDFFVDVARHPLGSKLATMQAIDAEGDRVEYSLPPANYRDASPYFAINPVTGELRLANKRFRIDGQLEPDEPDEPEEADDDEAPPAPPTEPAGANGRDAPTATDHHHHQAQRPGHLYFLNVAADDGRYTSVVELQIHVFNSSSFGTKSAVQLTAEGSRRGSERIESLMRNKTSEFFDRLHRSGAGQHRANSTDNASAVVYPSFVNPALVRPHDEPLASPGEPTPAARLAKTGARAPEPAGAAPPAPPHEPQPPAPVSTKALPAELWHEQRARSGQQQAAELVPQQVVMSLAIVVCAFLVIVLVLLAFVVPLSVKRLRERLKTVELQHEQLSQKASTGGSSTMCSSSAPGSVGGGAPGRLPGSLSQFTLAGSDGSCALRTGSSSSTVCRQSSLDSALTGAGATIASSTMYNRHHLMAQASSMGFQQLAGGLNRVNNGSIANPVYLHQHQQHPGATAPLPPAPPGARSQQPPDARQQYWAPPAHHHHQQLDKQHLALDARRQQPNDTIYYPLDDEFYSTITTESTIVDSCMSQLAPAPGKPPAHDTCAGAQTGSLAGQTTETRGYLASQCAPEQGPGGRDAPTPAESTTSSRSSTRSLARFLSLPARHWSRQQQQQQPAPAAKPVGSLVDELHYHFGQTIAAGQRDTEPAAKTIARTSQIERERQTRTACRPEPQAHVWELERHRLKFLNILDEGQFGLVWRCKLKPEHNPTSGAGGDTELTVAVKTLKSFAAKEQREREELLAEIAIMKLVCGHPNVVKILHCCTNDLGSSKPILLVMEHVELGKLQSFLERSRTNHTYATTTSSNQHQQQQQQQQQHHDNTTTSLCHLSNSSAYSDHLTSRDLIKFIYHVAKGMEYISSQCIVHRDLASRNILVSEQRVCKIGDFGMARHMQSLGDVYERHSRNAKVPVRWMAPEVLLKNRFTTKSDVFSFGILMWEIVTLGSTPYRHLKTEQVVEAVALNGERPSKPEYCHSQLYKIMSKCWSHEPDERPTFRLLVKQLDELLLSANEYIELDQYPDHNYYNIPKQAAPYELL